MTSILESKLAQLIGDALLDAEIPIELVLSRTTGAWPNQITTEYPCLGWADSYSDELRSGTMVTSADRRVFIIVRTLAIAPKPGDTVLVRGKTYSIVSVSSDPALALYDLQART